MYVLRKVVGKICSASYVVEDAIIVSMTEYNWGGSFNRFVYLVAGMLEISK